MLIFLESRLRTTSDTAKSRKKQCTGGARLVATSTTGETRMESHFYRTVRTSARRRCFVFTPHRRVHARSENLMCALELLANMQKGRGQPGGHDLRWFAGAKQTHTEVDNWEASWRKIGGDQGGQARAQQRNFPERDHPRSGGSIDASNGRSGGMLRTSLTPPMWWTINCTHRLWVKIVQGRRGSGAGELVLQGRGRWTRRSTSAAQVDAGQKSCGK